MDTNHGTFTNMTNSTCWNSNHNLEKMQTQLEDQHNMTVTSTLHDHHHHQISMPTSIYNWPNNNNNNHLHHHHQMPLILPASSSGMASSSSSLLGGIHLAEEEEEELGAMKEMMYKMAAMQPVEIDPATLRKPKRRNVRISDDPQSVAARHRRERISERIRVLQRLVPGGTKMDTASMLEEAVRYVKFLKRQIRLLHSPHCPFPAAMESDLAP